MTIKRRLMMAFLYLGGEAVFYLIARIAALPHPAALTAMLGGIGILPFRTFLDYRESMKVKNSHDESSFSTHD